MHRGTDVVQDAHDAWNSLGLDQLTDDFVVEVVDRNPLYTLLHILLLSQPSASRCQLLQCVPKTCSPLFGFPKIMCLLITGEVGKFISF